MNFSRLRDIVASKLPSAQNAPDPEPQVAAEQPEEANITEDWEEVSSSSTQRSRSSSFGDDASVISWQSSLTLSIDRQQASPPTKVLADSGAPGPVVYSDQLLTDYELVAPSPKVDSSSAQPENTGAATKKSEGSREDPSQRTAVPPLRPTEKEEPLRRVSSDATLVDSKCAPPQIAVPDIPKNELHPPEPPIPYKFPTFDGLSKAFLYTEKKPFLTKKAQELAKKGINLTNKDNKGSPRPEHNVTAYHTKLCDLMKLLMALKEIIPDEKDDINVVNLRNSIVAILGISRQIEPILQAYSKNFIFHGSGSAAPQYPLNLCLWDWMEEVKLELVSLREEQETVARNSALKGHKLPTLELLSDYMRHFKKLQKLHMAVAEFLPMIQGDFKLFNAHMMGFVTAKVHGGKPSSPAQRQAPHPAVARMRRQLFDLKDAIGGHHTILANLLKVCPLARRHDMGRTLKLLLNVSTAITRILTNSAPSRIESDPSFLGTSDGQKLPRADFVTLDPEVIHDVTGRLRQMNKDLSLSSVPREEICFTTTPLRNHQMHMLLHDGLMKELLGILEFIKSLVMPNTAGETEFAIACGHD